MAQNNDVWTGEDDGLLWHVYPTDEHDRHTLTGSDCPCNPRAETGDGNTIVVHNSFDGREAVEQARGILNAQPGMQKTTPEQSAALTEFISDTFNVDLEAELKRGEEATKGLLPYLEHMLRMGSAGVRQSLFSNGKEYTLTITIDNA